MSDLEEKLDLLISIQRVAHRDALERLREEIMADPVDKSILSLTSDWTDAGTIKTKTVAKADTSEPTVKRRLAELVELGVLLRQGGGSKVQYRSSGLL